jgi:hypothetical protein
MALVLAWRRRLFGGVATAAFAPAVLVIALLVVAFTGGFAGLGALTQAFAGPTAPSQPAAVVAANKPLPATVLNALAAAAATSAVAPVRPVHAAAPARHHVASIRPTTRPVEARPHPPSHHGTPGGGGKRPQPPPRKPTAVDRIVSVATSVTSKLPPPVGPTATQALQSLGSTVDKILPPVPQALK